MARKSFHAMKQTQQIGDPELISISNLHGYKGKYIFIRQKKVAELIDELISELDLRSALNVGCGLGIMEQCIKKPIPLLGIDINQHAISVAKQLTAKSKNNYHYAVRSIEWLIGRKKRRKFDLIILSEVIEHTKEEKKLLFKLRNLLTKKGVLVLSVPNKWQPRNIFRKIFFMPLKTMDITHLREYSKRAIKRLIKESGFKILMKRSSVFYFPQERIIKKIIKEDSRIRSSLLKIFPGLASHFIYALQKDEKE